MIKKILASLIIAMLAFTSVNIQSVSADTYVQSGYACKSGNNVFFAFPATKTKNATPIYKFNINTAKRTKIYPKRKSELKEFKNINALGKYVYCSARRGNSLTCSYVYRINTKNGKIKKLAKGVKPTLLGNKIVFESLKKQRVNDNLSVAYSPSGKDYTIPKEGGKKKPANHTEINVETSCPNKIISYGKYSYYITKDKKKIYRKNGSKKLLVCKAKKITSFRVLDGYLVVKTTKNGKNYAYCVKNNGSISMRMLSW